jgi:hypothetical protein
MEQHIEPLPQQQQRGEDGKRVEQRNQMFFYALCTPRRAREIT